MTTKKEQPSKMAWHAAPVRRHRTPEEDFDA
jgi:hypothetical protein